MFRFAATLTSALLIIAFALAGCGNKGDAETTAAPPAETNGTEVAVAEDYEALALETPGGEKLARVRCAVCHGFDRVEDEEASAEEWEEIVDEMIEKGAILNEEERDAVVTYLAETYGQ